PDGHGPADALPLLRYLRATHRVPDRAALGGRGHPALPRRRADPGPDHGWPAARDPRPRRLPARHVRGRARRRRPANGPAPAQMTVARTLTGTGHTAELTSEVATRHRRRGRGRDTAHGYRLGGGRVGTVGA